MAEEKTGGRGREESGGGDRGGSEREGEERAPLPFGMGPPMS